VQAEALDVGAKRLLEVRVPGHRTLQRQHLLAGAWAEGDAVHTDGWIEIDRQASGPQAVAVESSVAMFHGSRGVVEPAGPDLRSEPWIVAAMAKATLDGKGRVPWDDWVGDYARVRDAIEATYPAIFTRFNSRLFEPGGFARPVPARERRWNTPNGKANFITPARLFAGLEVTPGNTGDTAAVLQLTTVRSNDQFNTTIYGNEDRLRSVSGTRKVVFMNADDVRRLGLHAGQAIDLQTAVNDGVIRIVQGSHIVPYDIPAGCAAAYFPECNPLMPLWHHDPVFKVPGYKAVPVRVVASGATSVAGRGEEPVAGESSQSPI
jgi:anaerobic selenocysteine-containing dehydrogenase